jgi:D,D-heptose 1,7-bisphosphate phosphatase
VLLSNGDSFFDINLRALPLPSAGELTMALRTSAPGARYGTVSLEGGRVRQFHGPEAKIPGPINAGIYVLSRDVVERLPDGRSSLENDLFPQLAREGRIVGEAFDGFFIDMGVPEDLERAHDEVPRHTRRPAVFFDRDGVLNVETNYVHRPDQFEWMPGAREAIRLCNDRGYLVFVVTNQAGVAHGYYDVSAVHALHRWMADELALVGAHIDEFEFCPHHPEGAVEAYRRVCDRRKPGPGMIRDLLARWNVEPSKSFLVGDRMTDAQAAAAAGITGYVHNDGDLRDFVASHM